MNLGLVVFAIFSLAVMGVLFAHYSPDSLWGLSFGCEESFNSNKALYVICDMLVRRGGLTAREGEILFMCLQRKSPQTVADELLIEVSTVRTHIKRIYTKLGIHSRNELWELAGQVAR